MSKPTVSRAKVVPLHPESEPVTLADVTITWQEGDETKVATGRQIARLLTQASLDAPSGLFAIGHDAGRAFPLLRGLADLVFPDPRALDDLGEDTRYMISETLGTIAAMVAAEELDGKDRPRAFTVRVEPGSGLRNHHTDPPVTPEVAR